MDSDLILPTVILLLIVFIFIVPPFLWQGCKRIRNPVPLYLPIFLSVLVIALLAAIRKLPLIGNDNVMAGTIVMFTLLLLLVDLAVITPFPCFERKIGGGKSRVVFSLVSFIGAFLLFSTTAGGTMRDPCPFHRRKTSRVRRRQGHTGPEPRVPAATPAADS